MPSLSLPSLLTVLFSAIILAAANSATQAGEPEAPGGLSFEQHVRPILQEYCLKCHSTEKQKGDLDLEIFSSMAVIRKHPKIWQGVAEQLESHEMPPKEKPQPSPEDRARLEQFTNAALEIMAREHAGDPGPVILRRLSNAEYTYTVHDLAGVESLNPAREFPVDGAAGEGFTNTGQSLVMSPALLTKYLDAGKAIARHAMLLPDGLRFMAGDNRRDWTQEELATIRNFYRPFTSTEGSQKVNLQGIVFETNGGGRLPVEKYLAALLQQRAGLASGRVTPAAVASDSGLNAKYLGLLWKELSSGPPSILMDDLRARCQTAAPADAAAIAAEIAGWEKALWKFNNVGSLNIPGRPTRWMEPASKLQSAQEFHVKLPAAKPGETITLYLSATSLGEPSARPVAVIWDKPRVVAKGRPDAFLRDLEPALFSGASVGDPVDPASLDAPVSSVIEAHIPAAAAADAEFIVTGHLAASSPEASVQLQASVAKPNPPAGSGRVAANPDLPIINGEGTAARRSYEEAFAAFRNLFPAALCYEKIVPTDEVITLTQFYREDDQLCRLMLDDEQKAKLDALWKEFWFTTQLPLTMVDVLAQITEFAGQDGDPKPFKAMKEATLQRAAAFREELAAAEPAQLDAALDFANQAYRRPITDAEKEELRALYRKLRGEELSHDDALHLTLAKIFVSPPFLYRGESPAPGEEQAPVTAWELASRVSYFLCSSQPDAELRAAAASGHLSDPSVLRMQAKRLLAGERARRLATEFACQWLHLRDFDTLDEKSDKTFPTFAALRSAMLEESTRFFTDLFQNDGSVLSLLDADHTFLNEALAKHYGIPGVSGPEWRRVDGVKKYSRGGLLGQAAVLSKQAGASRTSPILRGDFIVETLLGEKIPRPPKDVPPFPEDQANDTLTVRQLTEKHSSDPRCARCHIRMDAFGFALESFDGIGQFREKDAASHAIEASAKLPDGAVLDGFAGLRDYLLHQRREAFLHQFCRKLLGFALGRGVQLSDEPLLTEMRAQLQTHDFHVSAAIDTVLLSRQFLDIRGREAKYED